MFNFNCDLCNLKYLAVVLIVSFWSSVQYYCVSLHLNIWVYFCTKRSTLWNFPTNELKRHLSLYGTIIGITSTWVHVCWHAKQRHTLSYGLKLKSPGPVVCFVISCHPVNDTVVKDKMQQLLTLPLLSSRLIKRWRRRNRIRQPFICFIGFILRIYRNLSGNTTWYRVSTLLIWLYGLKEYYEKNLTSPYQIIPLQ